MTDHEPAADETAALRARISALSAASLRISASLDLETVLNEVVDSVRALTGASLGGITTIDEAGAPQTFVTSGFTEAEHRRMAEWADGPRLFEHFRALEGPLRSADFTAYVHALGFPTDRLPFKTVQITPMHHRGVLVGNFYLAEKAGGEAFTDEDEEVLVLFASQAATAIANARTYRAERRARADLEALIETSPVGVVVFDARDRRPGLAQPRGRTHRQEPVRPRPVRRATARGHHLPARRRPRDRARPAAAGAGARPRRDGAVRGRSRSRSRTGAASRRLSTPPRSTTRTARTTRSPRSWSPCKDLEPLRDLERMRAEFLGMVSHELRAPLTSIKGSAATVLRASRIFGPAEVTQFFRIIDEQADRMDNLIGDLLDAGRIETGTLSVAPEPSEVAALVD